MVRPRLSVLVPTRGRADLAEGCVRALLAQDHPSFEIVVCDQSEDGATARALQAADDGSGRLRRVAVDGVGRSRALNAGLPETRGDWIVLTDDDCTPERGWLEALDAACAAAGPRAVVLGPVRPGPVAPGMAIPPATLEDEEPADHAGRIDRDLVYPNIAVPREAFAALGGFDERMSVGTPLPGGEDNDFGYRLLRAGWRIRYRPGPGVVHHAWRTPEARARLKRDYGVGQGAFYAKHLTRGDPWIAWRLLRDLGRTARAAGGAAVRGRGADARGHLRFLSGMLVGLAGMTRRILGGAPSHEGTVAARLARARVLSLEMAEVARLPQEARGADLVYVLLKEAGRPVGRLVVEGPGQLPPAELTRRAEEAAAPGRAALGGTEPAIPAGEVSVVVATRDRPASLARTLAALARLSPAPGEVLVADSASRDGPAVAAVAHAGGARLVRLPRPGLSLARNAGAEAASGSVVAFLDDDCTPEPGWVGALCRGFAGPGVSVVTGQLLPAELDTEAQRLFLRYAHMDRRGFVPARFDLKARPSRHWPLDAWRMGSGGNLAVRRDAFLPWGGFREDLGLGTAARGGEDLFLLWWAIRSGAAVVYRPDALAWHAHHRTREALEEVLHGYGVGHAAYLRAARAAGAPALRVADYRAMVLWDRAKRTLATDDPAVRCLVRRELAGMRGTP